jgi:hypothetical protein
VRVPAAVLTLWLVLGGVFLALPLMWGCGGPPSAAQDLLGTTARVVREIDHAYEPMFVEARTRARERSSTVAELHAAREPWDLGEAALRAADRALRTAQLAIDAWRAGDEGVGWYASVPCLLSAVDSLRLTMQGLGVPIPEAIGSLVVMASEWVGECEP